MITFLAKAIANGETTAITRLFVALEAPPPRMIWNPSATDLYSSDHRFVLAHWSAMYRKDRLPDWKNIDTIILAPAWGHLMLLEPNASVTDFTYRVYGSKIAERAGFDMTGKTVTAIDTSPIIPRFFIAGYQAVVARREPLYTIHKPPLSVGVTKWYRLTLPFAGSDGVINRLLVCNVPGDFRDPITEP